MAQELMPERISRIEEKPLGHEDVKILKANRRKQLSVLLSGYLPLIGCYLYIFLNGPASLNIRRSIRKINIDDDMKSQFWLVAPYFLGFLFIITNLYFTRLYFKQIKPLNKDISVQKKSLLYFKPIKTPMEFFSKYYISTPLYQKQQIEISQKDFNDINEYKELCLEIAPDSGCILRLTMENKELKYY